VARAASFGIMAGLLMGLSVPALFALAFVIVLNEITRPVAQSAESV
jgi:hypothetical protein